ncbi:MAG: hypothetical protein LBD88_00175 [Candidatus Peribacteria bacterium]|nr:hypothetical protein [Candidatus Peribacteria bacterium]
MGFSFSSASSIISSGISFFNRSSCIQLVATAHSAAAVIACINLLEFVVMSHAANIPFILVSCLASTIIYQELSFFGSKISIT